MKLQIMTAALAAALALAPGAHAQTVTGSWQVTPEPHIMRNGEPLCGMVYNAPGGRSVLLMVSDNSYVELNAPEFGPVPQQADATWTFPSGASADDALHKPDPASTTAWADDDLSPADMLRIAEQFATPGDLTLSGNGWSVRYGSMPAAANEAATLRECVTWLG